MPAEVMITGPDKLELKLQHEGKQELNKKQSAYK